MKTLLKTIVLIYTAFPLLAFSSELTMEDCLKKTTQNNCDQILNPNKQTIDFASLLLALDTLESSSNENIGILEEAGSKNAGGMPPEVTSVLSEFTKQSAQAQHETTIVITRKLINIFKSMGLQDHDYCLSLTENGDHPKMAQAITLIRFEVNKGYTNHRIIEKSISAIKSAEQADKNNLQRLKYETETSGFCELTNAQIKEIDEASNKKVVAQRISPDCSESAQTYQDRFRKSKNVNDILCFKKALEREYE